MPATEIKLGPPGTGKTTRLLNEVESLLRSGVLPAKIAYLAFTRRAATEARERAQSRFAFTDEEMPWFRTIHSLSFKQTAWNSDQLMKTEHYREVAKIAGFDFKGQGPDEENAEMELNMGAPADQLLFSENLARVTETSLEEVWRERSEFHQTDEFVLGDLIHMRERLREFKAARGMVDFTQVLEDFADHGSPPPVDTLILDEAQDLSKLQWRAIARIAVMTKRVIIAGDDDQAIFRWAGADIKHFLDLAGEVEVLSQSYRIPVKVHDKAVEISGAITSRRAKVFAPRQEQGVMAFIVDEEELDASKGSWLFLSRHGYQLKDMARACRSRGWFYQLGDRCSNQSASGRAVIAWENLRRGSPAFAEDLLKAFELGRVEPRQLANANPRDLILSSQVPWVNLVPKWTDWEGFVNSPEGEYFLQARRGGDHFAKLNPDTDTFEPVAPRIKISTIHGAKGGEADGVYIATDVSESTGRAMETDQGMDDERRVFYVGVTRARQKLYIKRATQPMRFEIEED